MTNTNEIKSCIGCVYYYVTWDPKNPKGCKYFGFKSRLMPCMVVYQSTQEFCNMYTPKN
jgi:hypothetical protein